MNRDIMEAWVILVIGKHGTMKNRLSNFLAYSDIVSLYTDEKILSAEECTHLVRPFAVPYEDVFSIDDSFKDAQ